MKGKPANNQEIIHKMERGLSAMEGALHHDCPHLGATDISDAEQKEADLLCKGIEDLKTALFYARNELICPECMTPNSAGSSFCCSCGLEFDH